jgi:3-deoxy-D-manno-octulosonic-acid transferase
VGPLGHSLAALGAAAALPGGLALLAARPGLRRGLRERLGARPPAPAGCVWVHGASVGEVRAATRLLDGLAARGVPVAASTTTVAGRDLLRRTRPQLPCALAPLDHPWCVAAAFRRVPASLLVLVETELWPSWILGARARGTACAVVSGRLSDRSLPRYRRAGPLVRRVLRALSAIGARSAADAERFVELGAPRERVEVTGDLKLDPPGEPPAPAPALADVLGDVPLVVAGSTHAGEEEAALAALDAARAAGLRAALALAPRHPERFDDVARLVLARGGRLRRRSRLGPERLADGEVLLLDSIGELAGLYAASAVAFVGGTLVPVGGHSPVEPAQAGRAPLLGPHTENAREAAALLLEADGAVRVEGGDALAAAVVQALRDPARESARGARAAAALAPHRGATERTLALLARLRAGAAGSNP